MKAYQIKIELIGTDPSIWRRVIMPADATFKRLHDVIQTVTNFHGYHLYAFDLPRENISVTNDEEAYQEHKHFMNNRKEIELKMYENASPENMEFVDMQLENLKTVVRKPSGIKIDKYLEKYKELPYLYDYGDGWQFIITLEKIVEDYKYGYPILIDGAETAPPEDVGGIPGYEDFIEAYRNETHPDHKDMKEWANEQFFREYDPEFINYMLKSIKYKKSK